MRLKQYLLGEWKVHKSYSGRDMIKPNRTILWQYIPLTGLVYTLPDGSTYINNKKIGRMIRSDDPKATHKKQLSSFYRELELENGGNDKRRHIEDVYETFVRGRIVGKDVYVYSSQFVGMEAKKYAKMVDKAIDNIYRYIEEKDYGDRGVNEEYINEKRGVTFIRFGGLSKVDQKKYGISRNFHKAPANKGIYAFIWPYIEEFLFAWKHKSIELPPESEEWGFNSPKWKEFEKQNKKEFNKFYRENMKKFNYEGWVWTHFTDVSPKYIRRRKGSWAEIHTSNFDVVLRKVKHMDMVELAKYKCLGGNLEIKDPYKRGLKGQMSRDHLEVFIEG